MRDLAGETVSDEFLYSLWINRIPSSVRGILSVADTSNLNNLAALADKVLDYTTSSCVMATSSSAVGESPLALRSLSNLEHRLQSVEKQLSDLTKVIHSRRSQSEDRSRRSRSRTPDRSG
ncbi:hypothetical protein KPH14_012998, partial [Odynerus spinipes]